MTEITSLKMYIVKLFYKNNNLVVNSNKTLLKFSKNVLVNNYGKKPLLKIELFYHKSRADKSCI